MAFQEILFKSYLRIEISEAIPRQLHLLALELVLVTTNYSHGSFAKPTMNTKIVEIPTFGMLAVFLDESVTCKLQTTVARQGAVGLHHFEIVQFEIDMTVGATVLCFDQRTNRK